MEQAYHSMQTASSIYSEPATDALNPNVALLSVSDVGRHGPRLMTRSAERLG